LINLIRGRLHTQPQAAPMSWLRGLLGPTVAAALTALHSDPGRAWTVESLASHVAISRATFVRRFTKHVGDPPAAYLTRLRMDVAAQRLRDTDDTIETIARAVGYESAYAFSRAFARERALPQAATARKAAKRVPPARRYGVTAPGCWVVDPTNRPGSI
jgi:transcriptional regulator GlxA family with amidase domain